MKYIKKAWDFYSVKFVITLCFACLVSVTTSFYILSGILTAGLTIYYFIHSFKDPAFKKKNILTKVYIYVFMIIMICAGILAMSGQSDNAPNLIRGQLQ